MRVLEVVPFVSTHSGGLIESIISNCRALYRAEPSIETTILATKYGLTESWLQALRMRLPPTVGLELFDFVGRKAWMLSVPATQWIWRRVGSYELAVINGHFNPLGSIAAWMSQLNDVPYIIVPHGMLSEYTLEHGRKGLKRVYYHLIEQHILRRASAVRFTSLLEQGRTACSIENSVIIPHPFEAGSQCKENWGPREGGNGNRILFLGRFDPIKGIKVLLGSIEWLRRRCEDVELVLAGSGSDEMEGKVREWIKTFGLSNRVQLPGFVEGEVKRSYLETADVFVLPSKQENYGIAVVEAMEAGLPVVITQGVGIWQEVAEYGAGLVVERRAETIGEGLRALLEAPDLRRKMGREGQRLVREQYGPVRIGRRLARLYHSVSDA